VGVRDPDGQSVERKVLERSGYWSVSKGAWHSLLFVLPGLVFLQVGALGLLGRGEASTGLKAEELLRLLFEPFGLTAVILPSLLVVVVLVVQHMMSGKWWGVSWGALGGMVVESLVWTVPLLILLQVLLRLLEGSSAFAGVSVLPSDVVGRVTVLYTHLTLPTICSAEVCVGAVPLQKK